jgi:hypothetical protein
LNGSSSLVINKENYATGERVKQYENIRCYASRYAVKCKQIIAKIEYGVFLRYTVCKFDWKCYSLSIQSSLNVLPKLTQNLHTFKNSVSIIYNTMNLKSLIIELELTKVF